MANLNAKQITAALTDGAQEAFKLFVSQQGGNVQAAVVSFESLIEELEPSIEDLTARAIAGDLTAQNDLPFLTSQVAVLMAEEELSFVQTERAQTITLIQSVIAAGFKAAISLAISAAA